MIEKKDELVGNTYTFIMTKDISCYINVYYSLTLPVGVSSNQENNNKIKENSTVILTFTTPIEDIASFKVNAIEKKDELVDINRFIMTKDVTVVVTLNVYYTLILPDEVCSIRR